MPRPHPGEDFVVHFDDATGQCAGPWMRCDAIGEQLRDGRADRVPAESYITSPSLAGALPSRPRSKSRSSARIPIKCLFRRPTRKTEKARKLEEKRKADMQELQEIAESDEEDFIGDLTAQATSRRRRPHGAGDTSGERGGGRVAGPQ